MRSIRKMIFHMTGLPSGGGDSSLQNLMPADAISTKISAIECTEVLDGGGAHLKKSLNLEGSA
jgi:hypothetical protein